METIHLLLLLFIIFFIFFKSSLSQPTCPVSSCDRSGPKVRFPFRIRGKQSSRCGYPGFELHCNQKNQTILTLPAAGDFTVSGIDYKKQYLFIDDPDFCLPRRILNFSYSGSPFRAAFPRRFTFVNCSDTGVWTPYPDSYAMPALCLSTDYSFLVFVSTDSYVPPNCRYLATVVVPVQKTDDYGPGYTGLNRNFQLGWKVPGCGSCEGKGGICGFVDAARQEIGCFNLPRGISRKVKYGLIIGAGIPGFVCLIGFACYICGKIGPINDRRSLHNPEILDFGMITRRPVIVSGLDTATIETYPKIVLGESKRLPNPTDMICPICLGEYQAKETLRSIPECNHYFHASCVDEWLKLNSTCPLCRKSPSYPSSVVTPSSTVSSALS